MFNIESADKTLDKWNEIADLNGDGIVDILKISSTGSAAVYYGNGSSFFQFVYNGTFTISDTAIDARGFRYANQLIDMNGDGLMDIVNVSGASFSVRYGQISSGNFSFGTAQPKGALLASYDTTSAEGFRSNNMFADANGDGLVDVIRMTKTQLVQVVMASPDGSFSVKGGSQLLSKSNYIGATNGQYPTFTNQMVDVNGDGILDIVSIGFDASDFTKTNSAHFVKKQYFYFDGANNLACPNPDGTPFTTKDINHKYASSPYGSDPKCQQYYGTNFSYVPANRVYYYYTDDYTVNNNVNVAIGTGDGGFVNVGKSINVIELAGMNIIPADVSSTCNSHVDNPSNETAFQTLATIDRFDDSGCTAVSYKLDNYKGFTNNNQFADIDGDGFVDIVSVTGTTMYVAYGVGDGTFKNRVSISNGPAVAVDSVGGFRAWNQLMDYNADGITDIFSVTAPATSPSQGTMYTGSSLMPSLVESFSNGVDLKTTVTYSNLTKYMGGQFGVVGAYPQRYVTPPMYVVTQHSEQDNSPAQNSRIYGYNFAGAKIDFTRGWLGFGFMGREDFNGSGTYESTTFRQDYPYIGKISSVSLKKRTSTQKLRSAAYVWGSYQAPNQNYRMIYEASHTEDQYDDNSAIVNTRTTTYQDTSADGVPYDSYGNPEKIYVTNTKDAHTSTTTFSNTYHADTVTNVLGLLKTQDVTTTQVTPEGGSGSSSAHREFDAAGRLTLEQANSADPLTLKKQYTYHDFNMVKDETATGWDGSYDASGNTPTGTNKTRTTSYDYTGLNNARYWIKTTKTTVGATTHDDAMQYDGYWGVPDERTTPDLIKTKWGYDALGRVTGETRYSGSTSPITTSTTYSATCPTGVVCATSARMVVTVTVPGQGITVKQIDALGHEVRTATQNAAGTYTYVDTEYTIAGIISRVSEPYTTSAAQWTTYTNLDAYSRPQTVTSPNGLVVTTTRQNAGYTTLVNRTTTDQPSTATTYLRDSQGNVVDVTDAKGGQTHYTYKPFGLVTQIKGELGKTDASAISTMGYDVFGNKLSQNDPDLGNWLYRYNAFGEVVWQKDAKGQITGYEYDELGRLKKRTEVGTGAITSWSYDTAGKGLLDSIVRAGVTVSYGYDAKKRPTTVTTNNGTNYIVTTAYDDANDRVDTLEYLTGVPEALKVKYGYYNNGLLKNITEVATSKLLWQADTYTERNQVNTENWGTSGVASTRGYDPATGKLTSIVTNKGINALQNLGYTYFMSGNLWKRNNTLAGVSEIYSYDALDRLTGVIPSNAAAISYEYDLEGNIKYKSGVGTYTYGAANTRQDPITGNFTAKAGAHAVTGISVASVAPYSNNDITNTVNQIMERSTTGGVNCQNDTAMNVLDVLCMYKRNADISAGGVSTTYTYDANGNVLTGNGRTYTYNYFNKPLTISATGNSTSYTYDPDDQRLTKNVNNGAKVTTYIGKLYEKTVSGATTEHRYFISAGDRLVAQINTVGATKTYYNVHTDMLGSVDVITDASGAKASDISFDEFGDPRPGNWGTGAPSLSMTSRGYTGHETDAESGLINMNARLYDPVISRFVSADTVMDDMFNAQNLNRYSYVRNNPFAYTDPTGHVPYLNGNFDNYYVPSVTQMAGTWSNNISLSGYSSSPMIYMPNTQPFNGVGSETGNPNTGAIVFQFATQQQNYQQMTHESPSAAPESVIAFNDYVERVVTGQVFKNNVDKLYSDLTSGDPALLMNVLPIGRAARIAETVEAKAYSTLFETELKTSSYPRVSRQRHFQESNENLLRQMEGDSEFASMMQNSGVNLSRTSTGLAPRKPPENFTWHHEQESGVMRLVPKEQHTPGSSFWNVLHPEGKGGWSIWGKQ
ncbi:MAG: VCBS repeat-containing protein [Gammaproteobacteria bacterium]|nr:VCBS repeat-containing protein [Gammaproteobacteria bacterium]